MRAVKKTEHSAYQIHYHFVTPVKYRKAIFGHADRSHSLVEISKEIEERYAADTFALAIKEMGLQKVEALGLSAQGLPLVGSKRSKRSNKRNQRQIDGKYVCVHSSTDRKKGTLETLANRLGVGLKVEIIQ